MQSLERHAEIAFAALCKTRLNITLNSDNSVPGWLKTTPVYIAFIAGFMERCEDLSNIPENLLGDYRSTYNMGKILRERYNISHHP